MADDSRLVYSTERVIPRKEKQQPERKAAPAPDPSRCRPIVRLDRKGRGGKTVTIIEGLHLPERESEKLLKQMKSELGAGGTVRNGALEIQGDHCSEIMAQLSGLGYSPKRSGG